MIVTGDVAIASADLFKFVGFDGFKNKPLIINLEGAVITDDCVPPSWGTYNSKNFLNSFLDFNLKGAFLGNNHIKDVRGGINNTQKYLSNHGVDFFGAGRDSEESARGISVVNGDSHFRLIGFGWSVIGCIPATKDSEGVNPFNTENVLRLVSVELERFKDAKIIVVIHANYEFEEHPQPGHRSLARQLIDLGVYSVLFHHPHVVSSVEIYKNKVIAYSLGNWCFSYGKFFGERLKFPSSSFHQIAVEYDGDDCIVHHAKFNPPSTINFEVSESVYSKEFSLKSEFEGFSDKEYLNWFAKNRKKKAALPIYRTANLSYSNMARDRWVFVRQILVDCLAKFGLKKMRR
ncbi:CapA family protein [Idiomarina sp.]|uniref:CapA family protein n=1 Tax=Idiomarina sp. TaxID=1874361 RepID=UPI0025886184|nr:CapA family protein [Idiomarina sp.]